ncbi:RNA polymerase sigma factor [Anaerotignum sp.]
MEHEEKELLDKLYEAYGKNLYLMAKYRLGEEKAKDAVQMVFLVAALRMEQVYLHENKKLWLYQTMQNVMKQLLYDKKYTKDGQLREVLTEQIEEKGISEQYEFENLGIIADLQGILREREYQYIVERFVQEKTHQELAEIFDLSYSGVTSFGERVLKKTKKILEKTRKNEDETR